MRPAFTFPQGAAPRHWQNMHCRNKFKIRLQLSGAPPFQLFGGGPRSTVASTTGVCFTSAAVTPCILEVQASIESTPQFFPTPVLQTYLACHGSIARFQAFSNGDEQEQFAGSPSGEDSRGGLAATPQRVATRLVCGFFPKQELLGSSPHKNKERAWRDGWHAARELGAHGVWMGGTRLWSARSLAWWHAARGPRSLDVGWEARSGAGARGFGWLARGFGAGRPRF